MKLRVKEVQNQDGKFLILENDAIGQNLLDGKRWEPHFTSIVRKLVRPGDTAIDAGANFGHHTIIMAEQVGDGGAVHSYEPLRIVYQQLCANVFLNGLHNVYTHNNALGINPELTTMNPVRYFDSWVNIGDTRVGQGGDQVMIMPLDHWQLKPRFIKIDVQGSELRLLEGAKYTIMQNKPILFLEVEDNQLRNFGTTPQELLARVKAFGGVDYSIFQIVNEYPCDHLCIPRDRLSEVDLIRESTLYKLVEV